MLGAEVDLKLRWCGAAHYQLRMGDTLAVLDPLYTRSPGGRPALSHEPEDLGHLDYILLTHGHLDHARDFAALALRYDPTVYATRSCLEELARARGGAENGASRANEHDLDACRGRTFAVGDLAVTPHRVGAEEVDAWFVREMLLRPLRHRRPAAYPEGMRWLTKNLHDPCFAYHFRLGPSGPTMLYFGHLTDDVRELEGIDLVTVLALPYCPANVRWATHSQYLINRFRPEVTLVHHFDDFMHPYTSSEYLNLATYAAEVRRGSPKARFFFSKFERDVTVEQIRAAAQ
jgi:L-ascorbate metabolism protein UlaG (beta-lactamase superfamily)